MFNRLSSYLDVSVHFLTAAIIISLVGSILSVHLLTAVALITDICNM